MDAERVYEMPYTDPKTVKSPMGRMEDLNVIYDGGAGSWSLATMTWDKQKDNIGLRWNGSDVPGDPFPAGNPTSHGYPTWFILPSPLAEIAITLAEQECLPKKDDG